MKDGEDLLLDYTVEMAYMTKRAVNSMGIVNPRKLRKSQVNSIYTALVNGKHFDSSLVVERKKGYLTNVIDGQHRVMGLCTLIVFFRLFWVQKLEYGCR